jgi:uncharacterized protein
MEQALVSGLASSYLEGLSKGLVRYQSCKGCGAAQTLARYACHQCRSSKLVWLDASGLGTVYSFTVITRAPTDSFRALVPYTLLLVTLDEGPRLMGHGQGGLKIGDRVRAGSMTHDGKPLVLFLPEHPGHNQKLSNGLD